VTRLKILRRVKDNLEAVHAATIEGDFAKTILVSSIALLGLLIKSEEGFVDYLRFTLGEAE
jgi:hypothetical protein